jgi:HD-like signal output (HDOD) protein
MTAGLSLPIGFSPEDIVRELKHLPSAPKVLPRLKQLLSDGNSAMHEIVTLIRLDPGIAARVLQTANSAYFNSKGVRCVNVDEAVQRVGYDEVYELVAFAVASQVLVRPLEVYDLEADALWRSSVACAIAAELIATRTGQDHNVAYTIGLLHRVGMVAIDEWALRHAPGLKFKATPLPRETIDAERATLGFNQAEVGSALLKHWNFPAAMSEPVRWQYAPQASAGQGKMASLLLAAKWLRTAAGTEPSTHPAVPEASQLKLLGLSADDLPGLLYEVEQQLAEVSSLLDMAPEERRGRTHFPGTHSGMNI